MQLTCTAWAGSLNTRDDDRRKAYRSCQKHESLSPHDLLSTGRRLLGLSFITSLKSNSCTVLTRYSTTENKFIILQAQNTTVLQPNALLTGLHGLVFISKGRSTFPSANNSPVPMQTPQSLSVVRADFCGPRSWGNEWETEPQSWVPNYTSFQVPVSSLIYRLVRLETLALWHSWHTISRFRRLHPGKVDLISL